MVVSHRIGIKIKLIAVAGKSSRYFCVHVNHRKTATNLGTAIRESN